MFGSDKLSELLIAIEAKKLKNDADQQHKE